MFNTNAQKAHPNKKASCPLGKEAANAVDLSDDPRVQVKRRTIGALKLIRSVAECDGRTRR